MKINLLKRASDYLYREKHFPFYILAISVFVLLFQLEGSIGNWDEAIYSEVAKEGLLKNDWLSLWYKDGLWFEKPPLVIWLTMISYKMFGISELSTWFFPVVFGIAGILGVYYAGRLMFNAKIGFLAALVLVMMPHYLVMSRNNMMDIFLFTNLIWSFVFLLKTRENGKNLILAMIFLGLAFMSKSFASFLIYPVMALWVYMNRAGLMIKRRHIIVSVILFLAIVMPWHLFMYVKYGIAFIENYIGLHIVERFNSNMLDLKQSSDIFYYFKVLLQRSGSWWFVFIVLLPLIFQDIRNKINRKDIFVLLFWILLFFASYSASKTKLHHYILPIYAPMSLMIAYGLYNSYTRRSTIILLPLLAIFINIDPSVIKQVSDFGEARLILPLLLYRYFNFTEFSAYLFIVVIFVVILRVFFRSNRVLASKVSILVILFFSILIPFHPDRAPLAKEIGKRLNEGGVEVIRHIDLKDLNIDGSLVFYSYPVKVISFKRSVKNEFSAGSASFCLIDRTEPAAPLEIAYDFFPCDIIK